MIDLFSSQFEFFIGHKRNGRHTVYGKILSVMILLASISFFIVMTVKLTDNNMLPKIIQITEKDDDLNEIEFELSPISFFLLINGKYEKDLNHVSKYFFLASIHEDYDTIHTLDMQECQGLYPEMENQFYDQEKCLRRTDGQPLSLAKPTQFNSDLSRSFQDEKKIKFLVLKCRGVNQDGENCKTNDEITDFFKNNEVLVTVRNHLHEFNPRSKKLERTPIEQYILLGNQTIYIQQQYIKSTLQLDDGFLVNNITKRDYISDYKMEKHYTDNSQYSDNIAILDINLQSEKIQYYVEYPKLTEILPQVQSVFNTLCFLGVFTKFLSEALIFQDLVQNNLKYYYQKVNKLLHQKKINATRNNKDKLQISNFRSLWWYFKQLYLVQSVKSQENGKEGNQPYLLKNQSYVSQKSQKSNLKFHRSQTIIKNSDIYADIFDSVKQNIELKNVFKDLMELKTCVHFLLSEEQYAAIKKCGRNLPSQELLNKGKFDDIQNEENDVENSQNSVENEKIYEDHNYKKLNHIEKLDLIDKNQVLQDQLYEKFKSYHQHLAEPVKKRNGAKSFDYSNVQSISIKELDGQLEQNKPSFSNQINNLILESLVENIKKKRIVETQIGPNSKNTSYIQKLSKLQNSKTLNQGNELLPIRNKCQSIQYLQNSSNKKQSEIINSGIHNSHNNNKQQGDTKGKIEYSMENDGNDKSVTDNVDSFCDTQRRQVRNFFQGSKNTLNTSNVSDKE